MEQAAAFGAKQGKEGLPTYDLGEGWWRIKETKKPLDSGQPDGESHTQPRSSPDPHQWLGG